MIFRRFVIALGLGTVLGTTAMAGSIEGVATYRERIAVPPGAVLQVSLVDVSLADAPSVTLSAKRYALASVPATFTLEYDEALIDERMSYAVQASILGGDDTLLFTTDTHSPVLTRGGTNTVDLVMVKVAAPQEAPSLENSRWEVSELAGKLLVAERKPAIEFAESGAFGATGGCNRFTGQAEIGAASLSFPDNMAGTLMACPPPGDELERQFLKALPEVTGYVLNGDLLALTNEAGVTVMRLSRLP